jgi:hypothetical protein
MLLRKFKSAKLAYWVVPILVYLFIYSSAEVIAYMGNCHGWGEICWSRYDSGLYLEISKIGHTLYPCRVEDGYSLQSGAWCGNAGWAPLYPFLMYLLQALSGFEMANCGIFISHAFFIGYLFVSASVIGIKSFHFNNFISLILCGIFPGGIYFFSIFPMSLTVFFISLIFWSVHKQKLQYAIIPAFLLAISYSSAIVIFFSFGLYWIYVFITQIEKKDGRFSFSELKTQLSLKKPVGSFFYFILLPGLMGMIALFVYDYIVTGHWNAMYLVQAKYGHSVSNPFKHLVAHYQIFLGHLKTPHAWIDFHAIFFFFAFPFLLLLILRTNWTIKVLLSIFILINWYIPYSFGVNLSIYRSIAILAPIMAYLHPIKLYQKTILLFVFGVFYYFMGLLYIWSILI